MTEALIEIRNGASQHVPGHEIKAIRTIQRQRITIEQVRNESVVSIGSILISDQLRVLPDTDDIWEEEDSRVLVNGLPAWLGDVDFDIVKLRRCTCWLASGKMLMSIL